ncbi:HIT family protein [Sphingobacterium deserti]|uniref:Histidine triad (HIT) protein n=1 Tax=Sphingobacterium deserti TaxID=1229276 RepID=A0A0B8T595_9SPHI|nr:HIT family protein [Sphingobacterium deserti]KGE15633.1 histidine triad (HIT) protein [Sphingobacterium deserti]
MSTIFSKIVSGEAPAYKVAESNDYLAFLDVRPLAHGHVLVIPKKETDYIFDIHDDEYMGMWVFAKIVGQGIKKVFPCRKVGIAVVGLEVAHTHIHLIPLNNVDDMNFGRPKLELTDDELTTIAESIREAISEVTHSANS